MFPRALLFDFDGVILESVQVKTEAFRDLFKEHSRHIMEIIRYHLDNSGVNRYAKFVFIYNHILHQPLSSRTKKLLANKFSNLVFQKMLTCPFVPGARTLINKLHKKIPLFIVSATPEKELKRIIQRRGLKGFIKKIFGYPTSKVEAIQSILRSHKWNPKDVVYIGDARADWQAAQQTRIRFIGRLDRKSSTQFSKSVPCIGSLTNLYKLLNNYPRV